MTPPLRVGEIVRLRWGSMAAVARVAVASENGRSILVSGEFVLAGWLAHAPCSNPTTSPSSKPSGALKP